MPTYAYDSVAELLAGAADLFSGCPGGVWSESFTGRYFSRCEVNVDGVTLHAEVDSQQEGSGDLITHTLTCPMPSGTMASLIATLNNPAARKAVCDRSGLGSASTNSPIYKWTDTTAGFGGSFQSQVWAVAWPAIPHNEVYNPLPLTVDGITKGYVFYKHCQFHEIDITFADGGPYNGKVVSGSAVVAGYITTAFYYFDGPSGFIGVPEDEGLSLPWRTIWQWPGGGSTANYEIMGALYNAADTLRRIGARSIGVQDSRGRKRLSMGGATEAGLVRLYTADDACKHLARGIRALAGSGIKVYDEKGALVAPGEGILIPGRR